MCPVSNFFEFQLNTFLFLSFHPRIKRKPIIQFQILLTPIKEYIEHFCCIDKCYEVIPKLF